MKIVLHHLRRAAVLSAGEALPDARLLEAFLTQRDDTAFEALLRRHGPMVLGVCRRVLRDVHDAEDAFQATFLVLVRKGHSLRSRDLLGSWLYGVAYRTAMKARAMNAKRRIREKAATEACPANPPHEPMESDLLERLDLELHRLPEKYRAPVVLCDLEGKSRKEAAQLLDLPEGTLSWRLAQARKMLAKKLGRHAEALATGGVAAALAGSSATAGVPPALVTATAQAARLLAAGQVAGMVSAQVMILTEGVIKAMFLSKLKVVGAVALAVSISTAAGLTYHAAAAQPRPSGDTQRAVRVVNDELEALRLDVEALRRRLEITRERVGELEKEVQKLKQRETARGAMGGMMMGGGMRGGGGMGMGMMGPGGAGASADGMMPGMADGTSTGGMPGMAGGMGMGGMMRGLKGGSDAGQPKQPQRGKGKIQSQGGVGDGGTSTTLVPGEGGWSSGSKTQAVPHGSRSGGAAMPGGTPPRAGAAKPKSSSAGSEVQIYEEAMRQWLSKPTDPLADAEKALKQLRQNPNDQQAAEALQRATQKLRERAKPKAPAGGANGS
jgi:RNA polymerase sigma factor (sigma-70 family)